MNETIVEFTDLSLRTVQEALRRLEASRVVRRYKRDDGRRAYALQLWMVRTDLPDEPIRELVKKNKITHAELRTKGVQPLHPQAEDGV